MLDGRGNRLVDQVMAGHDPAGGQTGVRIFPKRPPGGTLDSSIQEHGGILAEQAVAGGAVVAAHHAVCISRMA